jgi:uncharacterized RDD family membrane protein YckC
MASELPSIARRLASMLYEGLVVFSILLIGFLLPQIVLSGFGMVLGGRILMLHIFILLLGYFVWCWLNGGQTLPMKTWKLRITNNDGYPLRPTQAILRYMAAWPSILLGGIGIFWAVFDKDKQFLHDRIAGSRIITYASPEA